MFMQKAGRSARKENLSVFAMSNMTFLYFTAPALAVIFKRIVAIQGSILKDEASRLNSLKTVGVFSYFAS